MAKTENTTETAYLPAILGLPDEGGYLAIVKAANGVERAIAVKRANELVKIPESDKAVPRFTLDLPWQTDSDAIIDSIVEQILGAESIEDATAEGGVINSQDMIGTHITLNDVRAMKSNVADARWGVYFLLDVDTPTAKSVAVATGAPEAMAAIWWCYVNGRFPVRGMFTELGNPTPGRNQPIGFRVFPQVGK